MSTDNNNSQSRMKGFERQYAEGMTNSVGPDFTIPTLYYDDQHMSSSSLQQQYIKPDLFDEEQFKDGFGPVYAEPTFPWHQNQQNNNDPRYPNHVQENNPDLFGQDQFVDGFGPVYAEPTFPWHHQSHGSQAEPANHKQGPVGVQWQQGYVYPQAFPAFYMYPFCTCSPLGHSNHE